MAERRTLKRRSALKRRVGERSREYSVDVLARTMQEAAQTVTRLQEAERINPQRLTEPVTL
jgi:hypothetical protein